MTDQSSERTECDEIVERLWPHLDGALPESERARVVRHLESCTACRSHYDYARAFLEAVHEAQPNTKADDALRRRVLAALGNEGFRRR
jgi:anti-sigma factor (TIGR02949 family)